MSYTTKEQSEELVKVLEPGKDYTFLRITDFGFTAENHVRLVSAEIKPYAQYDHSVTLKFKVKNKRLSRNTAGLHFNGLSTLAVYEGWRSLKDSVSLNDTLKEDDNFKVTKSKYFSFDRRNLTDVTEYHEKQGIKPIFSKVD